MRTRKQWQEFWEEWYEEEEKPWHQRQSERSEALADDEHDRRHEAHDH